MLKKLSLISMIGFLFGASVFANQTYFNWSLFKTDIRQELRKFEGTWSTENNWKRFGCNGAYHVNLNGKGVLTDIKFDVQENGSARVIAEIANAAAGLLGDYKGAATICYTVSVGFVISAYDIVLDSEIYQVGSEEAPQVKIVVKSTKFGRISLGKSVPDWVNQLVTSWVNRGLAYIWETSLGEMINKLISNNLNRYLRVK